MPPCQAELEDHDIVTYSFGDQEAIYLRGQWTIHRNSHQVSTIWRSCPHLGAQLQKECAPAPSPADDWMIAHTTQHIDQSQSTDENENPSYE